MMSKPALGDCQTYRQQLSKNGQVTQYTLDEKEVKERMKKKYKGDSSRRYINLT